MAACFGKVPLAADFVAHGAGSGTPYELQRWLLDGSALARERTESRWKALYAEMGATRFLFRGRGDPVVLAGTWVRSTDRSGREFPFAVFTGAEESPGNDPFAEATRVPALLELLETLASRAAQRDGIDGFPAWEDLKRSVDAAEAGGSAGGSASGVPPATVGELDVVLGRPGATARITANLLELAHRTARWAGWLPDFALRFPLPAAETAREATRRFWTGLSARVIGSTEGVASAFWTGGGDRPDASLDLYYEPAGAHAFLYRLDADLRGDPVYLLHQEEAPRRYLAERPDIARDLGETTRPLADLLAAASGWVPPRNSGG